MIAYLLKTNEEGVVTATLNGRGDFVDGRGSIVNGTVLRSFASPSEAAAYMDTANTSNLVSMARDAAVDAFAQTQHYLSAVAAVARFGFSLEAAKEIAFQAM